jgi:hypothetical protein
MPMSQQETPPHIKNQGALKPNEKVKLKTEIDRGLEKQSGSQETHLKHNNAAG